MKIQRLALSIISVTAIVALIAGCATTKKAVPDEVFFETWSGTWANNDIPINSVAPQKFITYPDGTLDYYSTSTSSNSTLTLTFTIFDKWADKDGNTWFKAQKRGEFEGAEIIIYEYGKINDSGDTYELIYHVGSGQVEDWEPDNPIYNYVIYYRQ